MVKFLKSAPFWGAALILIWVSIGAAFFRGWHLFGTRRLLDEIRYVWKKSNQLNNFSRTQFAQGKILFCLMNKALEIFTWIFSDCNLISKYQIIVFRQSLMTCFSKMLEHDWHLSCCACRNSQSIAFLCFLY